MRIFSIALVALSLTVSLSTAARAGDCPGMLSYTYEAGECTDKTGETTDILIRSGNEAESLQQGMIARSHSVGLVHGGSYRPRGGVDINLYRAVGARLWVGYNGPSIMPPLLAKQYGGKNGALRKKLETLFNLEVYNYDHNKDVARDVGASWLPGARVFFLEGMYDAYDGEVLPEDGSEHALEGAFTGIMVHAPITTLTRAAREMIREFYIIRGTTGAIEFAYYAKRHDEAKLAALRREARQAVIADTGIDPAKVRLPSLFCVARPMRSVFPGAAGCETERRLNAQK